VPRPVLFLGRADSDVLAHLRAVEPAVVALGPDEPVDAARVRAVDPVAAVVHGYRRLIRPPVLDLLPGRIVNLHISLLPWNRGSDPNLWSFVDDTPKGVTIHHVDPGLDTGDIVAQRELAFGDEETLGSTYAALQAALLELFLATWPAIRAGTAPRTPQRGPGSAHRSADRAAVEHLLTAGWETRVGALRSRLPPS
jgi:methionyl-tRNA formyltransferase